MADKSGQQQKQEQKPSEGKVIDLLCIMCQCVSILLMIPFPTIYQKDANTCRKEFRLKR